MQHAQYQFGLDRIAVAEIGERHKLPVEDIDINPELTVDQQKQILDLLNEFSDVFAENPKKPALTNKGEHVIETLETARPVKSKRYRMSPQQEEEISKQADQMVQNGIARESLGLKCDF